MLNFNTSHTLAEHYVYATDCQIATLGHLVGIKRTAKSELERQHRITRQMVQVIRDYVLPDAGAALKSSAEAVLQRFASCEDAMVALGHRSVILATVGAEVHG